MDLIYSQFQELKDGTPVRIRLLERGDRDKLVEGFNKLSPGSRRSRFLMPISRLLPGQIKYLTEIDNVNHVAFCVQDFSNADGPGIGVGRYIRVNGDPDSAEIAITVIDSFQGRGVGSMLMESLKGMASMFGIGKFCGYMLRDNKSMLSLFRRYDGSIIHGTGALLKADMPIRISKDISIH